MLYITGIHALNLPCELETCGDWHQSSIQWADPHLRESSNTFYKDYGIEKNHRIPEHEGVFNVANTIRAILDLLYDKKFSIAQGMNEDYICNPKYDQEVFMQVSKMKFLDHWQEIDAFMSREYRLKWLDYKENNHV